MSKQNSRCRNKERTNPTILRRKRKADSDLEVDDTSSSSSSSSSSSDENKSLESVPTRSSFTRSFGVDVLLTSHPLMRPSTLPDLSWATADDVWKGMIYKDITYKHDHKMFERHPELQPRMRAILLDWLIEVCEVYKLHRETFYLAQDCIDRYLCCKRNVPKHQLQLLGIASLFIAAKVEEIYPPKLSEFAYVTDGACTEKEILHKELVILMTLEWNITPVTINSWLNVFLQVATCNGKKKESFERQEFSSHAFNEICQLLDLCVLDVGCLQFPYSVLAASAITHLVSKDIALSVSGFKWNDIAHCVHWMTPFVETINEQGKVDSKLFHSRDMHTIQTHNIEMKLLEKVQLKQEKYINNSPSSDSTIGVLTPPQTTKKISLKRLSV